MSKRFRGLGEPPLGYRAEATLVGVAGTAVVVEPNVAGLRMRGRLIVPTPKPLPSPSPWPVARSGLTPGP